jgi:putative DNA methylase
LKYPKKLIEVALPLDDINREAAREKSIRHGHPSTLHLWWARRPLAAARAVLFAQLVNDPGDKSLYPKRSKKDVEAKREELFQIIRLLVKWENTTNEEVIGLAKKEIEKSWIENCELTGENPETLPPFLDPFSGGGTIPLEAQRLGLEAHGSDLNPVAVMIGKALVEIPARFRGVTPTGPPPIGEKNQDLVGTRHWIGNAGLAEDVRRYGILMKNEANKKIGYLYPQVNLPKDRGGEKATVIAWLWARTVECQNPACRIKMPLVKSFILSSKPDNGAWIDVSVINGKVNYEVRYDEFSGIESTVENRSATCVACSTSVKLDYVRSEAQAGRMNVDLMAIVAEARGGRIYLTPDSQHREVANSAKPEWLPEEKVTSPSHDVDRLPMYGMKRWGDAFTLRQLVTLTTFSDLIGEIHSQVIANARSAGMADDGKGFDKGGTGASAYADAIAVYLTFAIDKVANLGSSIVSWMNDRGAFRETFARQAIPMVWDFAESNPFSNAGGSFELGLSKGILAIQSLPSQGIGFVTQASAQTVPTQPHSHVISTDPPYYDNIGYADLSDFFYVWMRQSLKPYFGSMFSTLLVPKEDELVASTHRHGGKTGAEKFFLEGMKGVMKRLAEASHPSFPVTIYYAFKQSETDDGGTSSTGWETFLQAVIDAGFDVVGTWPMRTEGAGRLVAKDTNALASSIILVCRQRPKGAETVSRKQFIRELEEELPSALEAMVGGTEGISPVAAVDLSQASIGPGIGVFSRYQAVLEADGSPMKVKDALMLINKAVDEYFDHAESDMDSDTRFCVEWFKQFGFTTAPFGQANIVATSKGTSVEGVVKTGVLEAKAGKVRLLKVKEYLTDWDPAADDRLPVWEACHQLCRALLESEGTAGLLLARMPTKAESVRKLAYRLFTLANRNKWSEEAGHYDALIKSWRSIAESAQKSGHVGTQESLL